MAKNFYTLEETLEKLDMTPEQLKDAVQNGQVREFRDGGEVTYKASEVDKIAAAADSGEITDSGLSGSVGALDMLGSGELVMEKPADESEDSAAELRFAGEDDASAATPPAGAEAVPPPAEADASGSLALAADTSASGDAEAMGTGELVLEPAAEDDSGIKLGTGADADVVILDDTTTEETEEDDKEGTVVTSIGVSVFDDDEVEQEADPLAQTVVSGSTGALGIDGVGRGSGLLDLTRESDDTSLGAELLDEIYPGDEAGEMGEATRAGLVEAIPEPAVAPTAALATAEKSPEAEAVGAVVVARTRVEFTPDAVSSGLTGMMFVGILVMCIAGLTTAAATQDAWPSILEVFAAKNWIVGAASLGAAVIALGIGFFLGKRSGE